MGELDIAVAGALGLAQRLEERFVADPIELARDRLKTDIGHCVPSFCPLAFVWRRRFSLMRSAG